LRRSGVLEPAEQMEALAKIGLAEFYQLPSPVAWRMRFSFFWG